MKKSVFAFFVLMVVTGIISSCNQKNSTNNQTTKMMENTTINQQKEPVMGLGDLVSTNFTGEAWLKMLSVQPEYDCNIYNVTFAPRARNNWHSHTVGQILLCTEGIGYYQEKGKPAQRLKPGAVVNIPAHTLHWHGAAPDSRFTHIGITPKVKENTTEWGGEVTDKEYQDAIK